MKSGNINFLEPSGPLQACNGAALRFFYISTERLPATAGVYWTNYKDALLKGPQ